MSFRVAILRAFVRAKAQETGLATSDERGIPRATPRDEPHPADVLPWPFRDNPKIRAAEAKRARRAAKQRGRQ